MQEEIPKMLQQKLERTDAKNVQEAPSADGSGPPEPSLDVFRVEQINNIFKEERSTSKFVDCLLCIEPVLQRFE